VVGYLSCIVPYGGSFELLGLCCWLSVETISPAGKFGKKGFFLCLEIIDSFLKVF
jgi:hypothetical protein